MARDKNFDYTKITAILEGTATETIESALEYKYPDMDEDDLTTDDLSNIDNEVFNCSKCGWWCEISEESGDEDGELTCTDCSSDEEE